MKRFLSILLTATLTLSSFPTVVVAQQAGAQHFEELSDDQKRELARLVDDGKAAYNRGAFEASLENFRKAYDIFPHPDMLYRMALCYERLGEDQEAVRYYRRFLIAVPDAPERPRVEKTIETIESRISKSSLEVITLPEGAVVYIDDIANGPAGYTPTELTIKPGNYRVIVEKKGYEKVEELVTITPGQALKLRYQLVKPSDAKAKQDIESSRETGNPNAGVAIALTAVGIGSAIASIVFFSFYSDEKAKRDELQQQSRQDVSRTELEDVETRMYTFLGVGIATAAIAAGTLLWAYILFQSGGDESASLNEIQPSSSPTVWWDNGPGAGWQFTW